jgi:hypothetical protein
LGTVGRFTIGCAGFKAMHQIINVNPTSEHGLYLRLFVTHGGGW